MGIKKWIMLCITVLAVAGSAFAIKQLVRPTETRGSVVSEDAAGIPDKNPMKEAEEKLAVPAAETAIPEPEMIPDTESRIRESEEVPVTESKPHDLESEPSTGITESTPEVPTEIPEVKSATPEPIPPATVESATDNVATPNAHVHSGKTEEKVATCLESGYRREVCGECGEILSAQVETTALGHDFTKSVWESPTCQMGGYYNNTCKRCGIVECVTEAPLPHEAEDIIVQEGNCMEDTIIRHVCKNCGVQVESDTRYTPYDLHTWVTEIIDGITISCCSNCGVVK